MIRIVIGHYERTLLQILAIKSNQRMMMSMSLPKIRQKNS